MLFLKTFLLCFLGIGALDAVWLGLMSSRLYGPMMGALLRPDTLWLPGLVFYLVFALGLTQLVIMPALKAMPTLRVRTKHQLIFNAALYGLATYGTYDLSAWAVISKWPGLLSVIDIGWGMFTSTTTAVLVYLLLNLIGKGRVGK